MSEPRGPKVIRYEIMVDSDVYARAARSEEAERLAIDAAREHVGRRVWTRLVGDGRDRAARGAARERFPDQKVTIETLAEEPIATLYKVRARHRIAGGWRETIVKLQIDELGRPRWIAEEDSDVSG